jgi:uncharacterized membrane protein
MLTTGRAPVETPVSRRSASNAWSSSAIWFNLVTLLTVAFMPFPAALLGSQSTDESVFPVVFFAASMTVASAALTATWLYAVRRDLTAPTLTPAEANQITVRAVTTTTVFAVSIAAALLGLFVAIAFWLGVLPLARVLVGQRRRRSPAAA